MSDWTILCDFDGTISVADTTDALLQRFARAGWETLEEAWLRGEIGSRECMAGQVALLDASPEELDRHLDTLAIDPAFPAFVAAAAAQGVELEVVSDGLDRGIRRILARHGLDQLPVLANRLVAAGPRSWRLEFPHGRAGCDAGHCKCRRAELAHGAGRRVLLVGDGASDFCAAEEADLVLAKGKLVAHCRTRSLPHVPIASLAEAVDLLPALVAGEIAARRHMALPPLRRVSAA